MLYSQNLQEQTRNFFQNGEGGGRPAPRSWIRLWHEGKDNATKLREMVIPRAVIKI